MVWDCFPFFNELDVLEIRLHELYDYVDFFVLVESLETHQGGLKPLYYEENKERFKKFSSKVIHVVLEERITHKIYPGFKKGIQWHRERFQRNQIKRVLEKRCAPHDIVMISDVDEVVRGVDVLKIKKILQKKPRAFVVCTMPLYSSYLNGAREAKKRGPAGHPQGLWYGTYATRWIKIKDKCFTDLRVRRHVRKADLTGQFKKIELRNSGWHFNSLGGFTRWLIKVRSYAHISLDHSPQRYADFLKKIRPVKIDESFPHYIVKNLEGFKEKQLILDES